jgi:hypothetical protein
MAIGAKSIETRHWPTYYRGPLLIHAAKTLECAHLAIADPYRTALQGNKMSRGALVGIVNLNACRRANDLVANHPDIDVDRGGWTEFELGNYDESECYRWGWVTSNAFRFPEPIPLKGRQGLFEAPDELILPLLPEGYGS